MTSDTIADTDLITTIDFGQSLDTMIAAGKYDWAHPLVTEENFPMEGTGVKNFRVKLFHFGHDISSKAAIIEIKNREYFPATHVHGLAFGATFPDEQLKYPIACLGSLARVLVGRDVVCLDGLCAKRDLRLDYWYTGWDGGWRFLGVKELGGTLPLER